jgi:hypothetical protein
MPLKTKRDRNQPFTMNELHMIEDAAKKDKNELVEQMSAMLQETLKFCDKEYDVRQTILAKARGFLALFPYSDMKKTIPDNVFARFKEFIDGISSQDLDTSIRKIHFESGLGEVVFKTNWASEIVAGSLARMLKKDDGSYWNNITFVMHYLGEQFDVVVQRRSGKSVKDQLNEAEAKIKALEATIEKYKDREQDAFVEANLRDH